MPLNKIIKQLTIKGRFFYDNKGTLTLYHHGSSFSFMTDAEQVDLIISTNNWTSEHCPYLYIVINNKYENGKTIGLDKSQNVIKINLNKNFNQNLITIYKKSEAIDSHIYINDIITLPIDATITKLSDDGQQHQKKLLVIGDSTSCGYGNMAINEVKSTKNSDGLKDYLFLASQKLNMEVNFFSASGWGITGSPWTIPKNASLLIECQKLAPFIDIPFDYNSYLADAIVLSVGTNDMFYILEKNNQASIDIDNIDTINFMNTYKELIKLMDNYYNNKPIIMAYGAMKEERIYKVIEKIYKDISKDYKNVYLLMLDGDGLGASGHPSYLAHKVMSDKVVELLKLILK